MNQLPVLLAVFLMFGCHPSWVNNGTFHSEFGYAVDVPQNWKMIEREDLQRNRHVIQDLDLRITDVALEAVVKGTLSRGDLDAFFIIGDSSNLLATVTAYADQNPNIITESDLRVLCDSLSGEFAATTDQPVQIGACEFRECAGERSIFLETNGPLPGLATAMYMVPRSESSAVLIGVTANYEHMETVRPMFEGFVSTLRIDSNA